ncbi:MAG TPA: glycosyltransferase [Chloroflexia bacterium]|nr:glycosyltransferase [Chloroflexia bacterium]
MDGKFIWVGGEKLYVKGVTYGPFHPDRAGNEYGDIETVERDFAQMALNGINAVRTYTVPPRWLLDAAGRHGLYVMVGIPWEQHVTFLDGKRQARDIENKISVGVCACAGHPALLCYSIGNEIPAPIVRWHGRRRIERFLERLYRAAKQEDPDGLVTYVNYPSTEYLQLPFLDFAGFNVYLEAQDRLGAYLARLQNLAGDRPLVMAEIGLDSRRNGEAAQARTLDWQVRTAFAGGCAGAFIFAWTDEWHRGGYDIEDWDFGLTRRDRTPKPALEAVRRAFDETPLPQGTRWPRVSVVVCSYNGGRTIRDCLEGLLELEYPDFEVIVVDDGSTDATAAVASEYGCRVISTPNRGLSSARNTGMEAATGEIVAYIDDDARPDPHWLEYIASTFLGTGHVAVGGPNIAPEGDGLVAECVANAPGGPVHVLLSDSEAEHIPGCNMAFRRVALQEIGGFDPQYRVAGDDVDVCWRLREKGWTLGFSPAAVVWHHRRDTVRAYWRQQVGYGRAEAMLEREWPGKYNAAGHVTWVGRIYGNGSTHGLGLNRGRIYSGTWGSAPFQPLYQPANGVLRSLPLMPEWFLVILALAALSALGIAWSPLLLALPLLFLAIGATLAQAVAGATHARFRRYGKGGVALKGRSALRMALTVLLHVLQPLARLVGRVSCGLTPWRRRGAHGLLLPRPRTISLWSEQWQEPTGRLHAVQQALEADGATVACGGSYDRWDLEVKGGMFGAVRIRSATEEHGAGKQLTRFALWPRFRVKWVFVTLAFVALLLLAASSHAWIACALLGGIVLGLVVRSLYECACATATAVAVISRAGEED